MGHISDNGDMAMTETHENKTDERQWTSLSVHPEHLDLLDRAAEGIFGTTEVSRSAVLERLIEDHPDVGVDNDGETE